MDNDSTPFFVLILLLGCAGLLFLIGYETGKSHDKTMNTKPCSYFASWATEDVPARCIKEFKK